MVDQYVNYKGNNKCSRRHFTLFFVPWDHLVDVFGNTKLAHKAASRFVAPGTLVVISTLYSPNYSKCDVRNHQRWVNLKTGSTYPNTSPSSQLIYIILSIIPLIQIDWVS